MPGGMTEPINGRLIRLTTAAAAAALIAVTLPLGYFHLGYQRHAGAVEVEAAYQGHVVSRTVGQNPRTWKFEAHRLTEFLAKPPADGEREFRRVVDAVGETVADHANTGAPLGWPLLARSVPILDSGHPVGRVEVQRSLRPLLVQSGYVAPLAFALAAGTFAA